MRLLSILILVLVASCSPEDTRSYYSQFEQDRFVNHRFFKDRTDGFFVDIGAFDGVTYSNSLFFEEELGWDGICIEPVPEVFALLEQRRSCQLVNAAVSDREGTAAFLHVEDIPELSGLIADYDPQHVERIESELSEIDGSCSAIEVPCLVLGDLLDERGVTRVDFLSIDTEGNELKILESIDFDRFEIDVIAVENNYGDPEIYRLLKNQGYRRVARLTCDEIYKRAR